MKPFQSILALATAVLALNFAGTARAQYVVTGTTAGGGNIIVGSGTLSLLGPNAPLSPGGFDNITINVGAVATGASNEATIRIQTSNNVLLNNGTVTSEDGQVALAGVEFSGTAPITNEMVTNHGSITGGNGTAGTFGIGGDGITILYGDPVTVANFTLVNSGNIAGGTGTNGSGFNNGGKGIYFNGSTDSVMTNVSVTNSGNITGGEGANGTFGIGGDALNFTGSSFNGITVTNSGNITGANGTNGFGLGGKGIYVNNFNGGIIDLTVTNSGNVTGGDARFGVFGTGGDAMNITSQANMLNVHVTNSGILTGGFSDGGNDGNGGGGVGLSLGTSQMLQNIFVTNSGTVIGGDGQNGNFGSGGNGIHIDAENGMDTVAFQNSGKIIAGSGSNGFGNGGDAVIFSADTGTISNVTAVNSGTITGGVGHVGSFGQGGRGININANIARIQNFHVVNTGRVSGGGGDQAVEFGNGGDAVSVTTAFGATDGLFITNSGTLIGGNATSGSIGNGGIGIKIQSSGATSNIVINNTGLISGGNSFTGTAGRGVDIETNNVVINNFSTISSGTGLTPVAINLTGSNNTVNLNGHSAVYGTIAATGSQNNVLNLNFTGLSPAAQAALKAQIAAQGNLQNFSGTFTVRGVTYNIDPMVINVNTSSYQQQALTPNQAAIGAALDSGVVNPTGDLLALYNAIDASGNVAGALSQLSPQRYLVYADLAISNATFTTLEIDQRLNNLRDGSESVDTTGMGGGSDATVLGLSKEDGKESKGVVETKVDDKRWGFFATANGSFFRVDNHDVDLQQTHADTVGAVIGIDGKIGENAVVGLVGAYGRTDADLDTQGSHADINSYSGGLYAGYHNGGFYVNALATYTRNTYSSQRTILIPGFNRVADGSTDGNQYVGDIDGGYDFKVTPRLTLGPIGGVQYVRADVDGFNERNAGAAGLTVGSQGVDSLRSRVGLRADYHIQVDNELAFALEVRAAWQHEFLDDNRSLSASFSGSGLAPFTVSSATPQRDTTLVGLGVNFTIRERLTLFGDYDLQVGSASNLQHSIKGGVKLSW